MNDNYCNPEQYNQLEEISETLKIIKNTLEEMKIYLKNTDDNIGAFSFDYRGNLNVKEDRG